MKTNYFIRIGDAISQFFNVLIFNGDPNYSISGESYRHGKKYRTKIIDFLFSPFEDGHCKKSYENDVRKAKTLLIEHNIKYENHGQL